MVKCLREVELNREASHDDEVCFIYYKCESYVHCKISYIKKKISRFVFFFVFFLDNMHMPFFFFFFWS